MVREGGQTYGTAGSKLHNAQLQSDFLQVTERTLDSAGFSAEEGWG